MMSLVYCTATPATLPVKEWCCRCAKQQIESDRLDPVLSVTRGVDKTVPEVFVKTRRPLYLIRSGWPTHWSPRVNAKQDQHL